MLITKPSLNSQGLYHSNFSRLQPRLYPYLWPALWGVAIFLNLSLGYAAGGPRPIPSPQVIAGPGVTQKKNQEPQDLAEMRAMLSVLIKKVSDLEQKLADLTPLSPIQKVTTAPLGSADGKTEPLHPPQKISALRRGAPAHVSTLGVRGHPSDQIGKAVDFSTPESAPLPPESPVSEPTAETRVTQDEDQAIDAFQKAMIRFRAKQYPETILSFSKFVENYPDHPLAGSALYYVAHSYFQQKEYKLAAQEYARIFTTYDRSTHITDALQEISLCEDLLRAPESATRHRQLLSSLFSPSPAAGKVLAPSKTEGDSTESENGEESPATEGSGAPKKSSQSLRNDLPSIPTAPLVGTSISRSVLSWEDQ